MENKGNKSGNIYQKLKGAGAWQSKDSAGPMIKGVGIKSPLNMKKSPAKLSPPPGVAEKAQQMKKDGKGPYAPKVKKDPYAKAAKVDPKLGEYVKQRKGLKKDSPEYAKIQNKINKAYGVKKRYDEGKKDEGKKVTTTNTGGDDDKKKVTTTEVTQTPVEKKEENVAKKTRKEVRLENKGKRKAKRKANQQKRADRIKKEGGTKVGNFLRKTVKGAKDLVKKKTDGEKISSAAQMKKSPMKLAGGAAIPGAGKKKKSPMKLASAAAIPGAGKKKKSPAKKALVGKQGNLPDHLVAKIKAAPGKMKYKK